MAQEVGVSSHPTGTMRTGTAPRQEELRVEWREGAEPSASLLSPRHEAPMQQHPLSTGGFRFSSLHRDSCLLLAPECSNLAGKDKY